MGVKVITSDRAFPMGLSFLRREFGERFVEDVDVALLYLRDASILKLGEKVLGVVFPVDEEEVVKLVRWARNNFV